MGNDTYILVADNHTPDSTEFLSADTIIETSDGGTDTVIAYLTYFALPDNIENLTLLSVDESVKHVGIGNESPNIMIGDDADDYFDGKVGADTMVGGGGNDVYVVDDAGDRVIETSGQGIGDEIDSYLDYSLAALPDVENLRLLDPSVGHSPALHGTGNDRDNYIRGNSFANVLEGGDGNDKLDGAGGADILLGGKGDDTYWLNNPGEKVVEYGGEGTDRVISSSSYELPANVENLTLKGEGLTATGNNLSNNYEVFSASDVIIEMEADKEKGGNDSVTSWVDFTLGNNVENLTLTGTAVEGHGNTLSNVLIGNQYDNRLDGGAGADTMMGGVGNDLYFVDDEGDQVVELSGQGNDTVVSSISYALGANVEKLILDGTAPINATGNSLANTLTGNAGNNVLNGGAGLDRLVGGDGDDTYIQDGTMDSTPDSVVELVGKGTDTVISSLANYTLASNVENLTLAGNANINGAGNGLDNLLIGNEGSNRLSGGLGNDTLKGGGGIDVLTDMDGNNRFYGGSGADQMSGGAGADMFFGGTGDDAITTGTGMDIIVLNRGDGRDTVLPTQEFGHDNVISFGNGISLADLVASKSAGNDLILSAGASDQITLADWFDPGMQSIARLQVVAPDGTVTMVDFILAAQAIRLALAADGAGSMALSLLDAAFVTANVTLTGGVAVLDYHLHGV